MHRSHAVTRPEPDEEDDLYPTSDGKPMAESPWHRDQMTYLIAALRELLRNRDDVQVGGNELFYWEEGNPRRSLSPDVWVAFGLAERLAPSEPFKLWVQGKAPDLVIELGSASTRREDRGRKLRIYRDVFAVREYVHLDMKRDRRTQSFALRALDAWRLDEAGQYLPVELDTRGAFVSEVLDGARLCFVNGLLRVIDAHGRVVPGSPDESRAEGLRSALRGVLAARGLTLDDDAQSRIDAVTDPACLERWLVRAATATRLDEVFGGA